MYSIGNFIYGFPLTKEIRDIPVTPGLWAKINDFEENVLEEGETLGDMAELMEGKFGFETMYDGGADETPGYFGVCFGELDIFSTPSLEEINIKATPSEEDKAKAVELLKDLPEEIKAVALPVGVYLVWSSS